MKLLILWVKTDVQSTPIAMEREPAHTPDGAKERADVTRLLKKSTPVSAHTMKLLTHWDHTDAKATKNVVEREHAPNGDGAKERAAAKNTFLKMMFTHA